MQTKLIEPIATKFTPVTIQITLESQKELNALVQLFNCAPLYDAMREIGGEMPSYELLNPLNTDDNVGPTKTFRCN